MRYGGAKGVLSLNPTLPGRMMVLRPSQVGSCTCVADTGTHSSLVRTRRVLPLSLCHSQVKFVAPHHRILEVCCVAKPVPYYLNRLGVPRA